MTRESSHFHIAIDGPVASGKGTIAKTIAQKLGILYVDTGAMYRVATLLSLQHHLPLDNEDHIVKILASSKIDLIPTNTSDPNQPLVKVLVNGQDVTSAIRTKEIDAAVGQVATHPQLRQLLVSKQQQIAATQSVVMEGRDITTKVLPHAHIRIYLDANQQVRIDRRIKQLQSQGKQADPVKVALRIKQRDHIDKTRDTDPLTVAPGVWHIDTTHLTIDQVIDLIIKKVHNNTLQTNPKSKSQVL